MSLPLDDTIAALASAPGSSARGIIRVSGAETRSVIADCFQSPGDDRWFGARSAVRCRGGVFLSHRRVVVPSDLYFWPDSRSYTGQPLAELHALGSPPLLEEALLELYRSGVRPARAGEFTLRAFLSGKVDLAQAEAVLGVIDAEDHLELESALRQLAGGLSDRIHRLRSELLNLLADLEAGLDFVDEDIEFVSAEQVQSQLRRALAELEDLQSQAAARMRSNPRYRVVLAGLPNAGKSTLFNALSTRSLALVSPLAGTTRDWLQAEADWNGFPVELIDTAGWEEPVDALNLQAQEQRIAQIQQADLIVWCRAIDAAERERAESDRRRNELRAANVRILDVTTKCDLGDRRSSLSQENDAPLFESDSPLMVCAQSQDSVRFLKERLRSLGSRERQGARQLIGSTAARSRESLTAAHEALNQALQASVERRGDELVALELRRAHDALGRIVGAIGTEDLLDRVFSRFCIGK